jgi:hypothetical protein
VYAVALVLAFVVSAGIAAGAVLVVSGDDSPPTGESIPPSEASLPSERGDSTQLEQSDADTAQYHPDTTRERTTPQDGDASYVDEVGEIQASSVDAFLDSHEKILRYDALTSGDVEKLRANQAALEGFADQARALRAPQKYSEHKDVFLSAIDELHEAAQLAYNSAADPASATKSDVVRYNRLLNGAAANLQQSNEILGKDYKTIEGAQAISISQ